MDMKISLKFGTKEWAPHNFNYMSGCSNNCVYCYAKDMAIRFKRKTADSWSIEESVSLDGRSYSKKDGAIMIPSSHDITPGNVDTTIEVMQKLLENGNDLLVVTKPHLSCVERIVDLFMVYRSQIRFRFTIGSADSSVLKLWEPGAADFSERFESLKYAYEKGYSTSISCEPLLDDQFDILYDTVVSYVSDAIWVGKMNMASKRVRTNTNGTFPAEELDKLIASQSDAKIIVLFNKYRGNPKIQWKESIKKVAIEHNIM